MAHKPLQRRQWNDIFVLDVDASHFDSGNSFNIQNTHIPGIKSTDIENGPYIIDDFKMVLTRLDFLVTGQVKLSSYNKVLEIFQITLF